MSRALGLRLEPCQACSKEVGSGLRVSQVTPDGISARQPATEQIRIGDVIVYIQGKAVENIPISELAEAISQFSTGLDGAIAVTLPLRIGLLRADPGENRHGGKTWTELEVKVLNHRRDYVRVVANVLSLADTRPGSLIPKGPEQAMRQLEEPRQAQNAQVQMQQMHGLMCKNRKHAHAPLDCAFCRTDTIRRIGVTRLNLQTMSRFGRSGGTQRRRLLKNLPVGSRLTFRQ